VLDAGCGVGDVAISLASRHGLRVIGIDVLDFNVEEARKRAQTRGLAQLVDFRLMSYSDIDLPDNHFDAIYTMETLVHAAHAERVLQEFLRVLKPGGRIVLFEYSRDKDSDMSPRAARIIRRINEVAAMPSFQRFEHGLLEKLVETAGFSITGTEDITEHMLPMVRSFALIGSIPYMIGRLTGRQEKVINSMSGVELYRYRAHWRYNILTAIKPA
jgi:ubiquinone/menaquinone biosynthesis C-methylase UbiE